MISVFDLTNIESFKKSAEHLAIIQQFESKSAILVGNMSDLIDERVVDSETAKELASEHGIEYYETSAYSG